MFCKKCGTQNPDSAAFCKKCGMPLNGQKRVSVPSAAPKPVKRQPQPQYNRSTPKGKRPQNKKMIVAVIAVIVLALAFALFRGRSYKATVKQYVNAQFEADAEKIIKLIPDGVLEEALEEGGFDDLDEMIDEMDESIQDALDDIERYLGEDWTVSYKITDVEKVPKKELEKIKKTYKKIDVKVSAAKDVKIELTIKAGETERSNTMDLSLIKSGRSWYIDVDSLGSLF